MGDRIACTKENPSDVKPYKWYHPDAKLIDSFDDFWDDSYDIYECPNCGIRFDVTV
ncbi:MAG: hypothetical protein ABIG63_08720 [Chloroflexota bacterium]|uniref:Uncharacterized protein n=1 Tax=viral metagenome TaxID=1070528 RepID=A0A6M3JDV5_9ZZZZ